MQHTADDRQQAERATEASEPLLALTDKAVAMAKESLAREGLGPQCGLRVGVVGGGCSGFQYTLGFDDTARDEDVVIEQQGVRLFVDSMSVQYLKGMTIDYVTGLHGAGFKFINPNASRTCGCGSSFSA